MSESEGFIVRRLIRVLTALLLVSGGAVAVLTVGATPALALDNGLAKAPPMGFNDWNAFGCNVSAQLIEQTADAMAADGMRDAGYDYVNIDDCWALPARDGAGHLVPDPAKFPDGIKAVADYVHADGLKLGIYNDSGIHTCSKSHGFPGSLGYEYQDALEFATWGVDYLKDDDCNQPADQQNQAATIQRYETQRDALARAAQETGHNIVFSICEKTDFGVPNSAWPEVGNLWRTTGDIHDTFSSMVTNFHKNVLLAGLAEPGAWNDPDMLEIGNGGQTATEYRSEMSLWSEMAAPLIAGTPIAEAGGKHAASADTLAIYENKDVIAVDQDPLGKQGTIVSSDNGHWVLSKPLANGEVAVALFNETNSPATISTAAAAVGLPKAAAYSVRDLWQHSTTETAGGLTASVAPHETVMYRVSPKVDPESAPPHTAVSLSAPATAQAGQQATVTATFTNDGKLPAEDVHVTLDAPQGWNFAATTPTSFATVHAGRPVQVGWTGTAPDPSTGPWTLTATAHYVWGPDGTPGTDSATQTIAPLTPSTDLSDAYNNVGITDDSFTAPGNFDGSQSSLSTQALAAVGVLPGSAVTHNGMQFSWPNVPAAQPDNVVAQGQAFALDGSGADLGLLAAATHGPATGTGTINYSDGSTQQFTLTLPDWYSAPPSGSDVAIAMTYRNRPGNTQQSHTVSVYLVKVALQAGKTPTSVTIPDVSDSTTSSDPMLHVFGLALGN
jgi:alpha-galactosidase